MAQKLGLKSAETEVLVKDFLVFHGSVVMWQPQVKKLADQILLQPSGPLQQVTTIDCK